MLEEIKRRAHGAKARNNEVYLSIFTSINFIVHKCINSITLDESHWTTSKIQTKYIIYNTLG